MDEVYRLVGAFVIGLWGIALFSAAMEHIPLVNFLAWGWVGICIFIFIPLAVVDEFRSWRRRRRQRRVNVKRSQR